MQISTMNPYNASQQYERHCRHRHHAVVDITGIIETFRDYAVA